VEEEGDTGPEEEMPEEETGELEEIREEASGEVPLQEERRRSEARMRFRHLFEFIYFPLDRLIISLENRNIKHFRKICNFNPPPLPGKFLYYNGEG
jgi:hypothetical protein